MRNCNSRLIAVCNLSVAIFIVLISTISIATAQSVAQVPNYAITRILVSGNGEQLAVLGRKDQIGISYVDILDEKSLAILASVQLPVDTLNVTINNDGTWIGYGTALDFGIINVATQEQEVIFTGGFPLDLGPIEWNPIDSRVAFNYGRSTVVVPTYGNEPSSYSLGDMSPGFVVDIGWSRDGRLLATGTYFDRSLLTGETPASSPTTFLQIWSEAQIISGASPEGPYRRFEGGSALIIWSPSNEYVASNGLGAMEIFHVATGEKTSLALPTGSVITGAAWSPDGESMAIASEGSIWIWDVSTAQIVETREYPGQRINSLVWSQELGIIHGMSDPGIYVNGVLVDEPIIPVTATPTSTPTDVPAATATYTPTSTATATPSPTPTPTPTPTPDPAAPVVLTSGSFRALQNPGDRRVYIERAMSAGIDPFDSPPSDGWTLIGRTNGAGDNGTLRAFTVINGVPYAAVQHATKGCIVITPSSLAARTQGQTRLVRIVAQQTAYCGGDWTGFAGG
jgi:hypothetical protein